MGIGTVCVFRWLFGQSRSWPCQSFSILSHLSFFRVLIFDFRCRVFGMDIACFSPWLDYFKFLNFFCFNCICSLRGIVSSVCKEALVSKKVFVIVGSSYCVRDLLSIELSSKRDVAG